MAAPKLFCCTFKFCLLFLLLFSLVANCCHLGPCLRARVGDARAQFCVSPLWRVYFLHFCEPLALGPGCFGLGARFYQGWACNLWCWGSAWWLIHCSQFLISWRPLGWLIWSLCIYFECFFNALGLKTGSWRGGACEPQGVRRNFRGVRRNFRGVRRNLRRFFWRLRRNVRPNLRGILRNVIPKTVRFSLRIRPPR